MNRPEDGFEARSQGALLSWIQQFAPYGVITLDTRLRVQSWNRWMEVHSGKRSEEVLGKELLKLYPDLAERGMIAPFERALSGETSVLSTSLHRYLLPLPSPLREARVPQMLQTARISPLLSGTELCGVMVLIEDVTQRESQADALIRQHRRDEILAWALAHFLTSREPRKSIRPLFFKIAEQMDFDTFLLYIRNIETGALSLFTFGGVTVELEGEFAVYPPFVRAAESPQTVVYDSVRTRPEPEFELLKKAGISAAIALPLYLNEKSLGLLCFATASRPTIDAEETELLKTISQYLASAVDRENTNEQLQKAREELYEHAQLLERRVEERTLRLQETISELETFSSTLAHDLKAPVRGMIGYCEVLQEDFASVMPPEVNYIVQKMSEAPRRMEALIKDLLKFSDISRRQVELGKVEIGPIVENVLMLRPPTVRQATTVQTPLHAVRGHGIFLHQLLSNLIDNAVKFVNPGGAPKIKICTEMVEHGTPSTRARPLLFNAPEPKGSPRIEPPGTPGETVRLWVEDEGIGIPADVHQKIFGIFERGVTAGMYEGTGMGLAIVARATQKMGGTCGVESEPGKGSRFWVELPAA